MKRLAILLLAALTALAAAACKPGDTEEPVSVSSASEAAVDTVKVDTLEIIGKLTGKWVMTEEIPKESVADLLTYFNFTDEEKALAELTGMGIACVVRFTEDGRYSYEYDFAATVESVKAYYDRFISRLFDKRGELTATYGDDVLERCPTIEEFRAFYAYMFNKESYEAMLEAMAAESLDYQYLEGTLETGRYTVSLDGTLNLTADNSSTTYTVGYEFGENTLKLIYSDGDETYTRGE